MQSTVTEADFCYNLQISNLQKRQSSLITKLWNILDDALKAHGILLQASTRI